MHWVLPRATRSNSRKPQSKPSLRHRCGYNRSYVAGLIKAEMGGFYTYVNRLRLQRVDAYLQQHPTATVQEAAEESGFVSRKAYYSAKAKLQA